MYITWKTPGGESFGIYDYLLNAGHCLIAGAQGSGKSTVLASMIHTAIFDSPATCKMIIIDPKRVDLLEYRDLPHVLRYATETHQIADALHYAIEIMESRYHDMTRRRLKEFDGARLFVFIDEMADLMTDKQNQRTFTPLIQRLAQLGRAAKITVVMASQVCLASVITTPIKANFASRLALRTATAQDSRNVIGVRGAEELPSPRIAGEACGIWRNGADIDLYKLPRYEESERYRLINHWLDKRNCKKRLFAPRVA